MKKEDMEAVALATWLKCNKYRFTHIANESGLPPKIAMLSAIKKKKMGLSPGIPDFMIVLKTGGLLFLELKRTLEPTDYRRDGKLKSSAPCPSDEQLEWLQTLADIDNVDAIVAYGYEQAKNLISEYDNN